MRSPPLLDPPTSAWRGWHHWPPRGACATALAALLLGGGAARVPTLAAQTILSRDGSQRSYAPDTIGPKAQLTALRASAPMAIDGRLHEADWARAPVATDFAMVEPRQDRPSAFETVVRVLFDSTYLYVGVFARDSLGPRGVRVQDLRRKFDYSANDLVGVSLDALHDGRTVVAFQVTPYGAQREEQVFDDGTAFNTDWEAVWQVRTEMADSGWTAELAIPWATLRYRVDGEPWGVNFVRIARRVNEVSGWRPWPRAFNVHRMRYGGLLVGLEPPPPTLNLRARPYMAGQADRGPPPTTASGARTLTATTQRVGGELTWAPTTNAVVDLTLNTDFAQADVDRQVINLSRFSVFFPERRQFFLENATLFNVGLTSQFVVRPFFSRRIGLDDMGNPVPIDGGARVAWRDPVSSAGALVVRQRAQDANGASTFGVGRYSRNVGRVGRVGALVAGRVDDAGDVSAGGRAGRGEFAAGALDFFTRFTESVSVSGTLSATTPNDSGRSGLAAHYFLGRTTNSLYTGIIQSVVTRDYDPPTGFVSRSDVVVTSPAAIGDWRPAWRPGWVRNLKPALVSYLYHTPRTWELQESFTEAYVDVVFTNGAILYPDVQYLTQRLTRAFSPVPGVTIPAGRYGYARGVFVLRSDESARVSLQTRIASGGYYDRVLDEGSLTLRTAPNPHVALAASYGLNRFRDGPPDTEPVTTHLFAPEIRVSPTPRLQLTAFYQRNSAIRRGAWNARASWEFAPLSYVYLVLNDLRSLGSAGTASPALPPTQQVVLKVTYLKQF